MGDVERVEVVDVTVYMAIEVVEQMVLQRVSGLHNVSVEVEPPEPIVVV